MRRGGASKYLLIFFVVSFLFLFVYSVFGLPIFQQSSPNVDTSPNLNVDPSSPESILYVKPDFSLLNLVERTKYSNIYEDNNGGRVAKISSSPINYVHNGTFEPIDVNITAEGCELDFCVHKGIYKAEFSKSTTNTDLVKVSYEGGQLSFRPTSFSASGENKEILSVEAKIEGNKITYTDIYGKGIDLQYTYYSDRLKEAIIIHSKEVLPSLNADSSAEFNFELTPRTVSRDNSVVESDLYLGDSAISKEETTKTKEKILVKGKDRRDQFALSSAHTIDKEGKKIPLEYSISYKDDLPQISIIVPSELLNNAVYPLIIDPGVEIGHNYFGSILKQLEDEDYDYEDYWGLHNIGSEYSGIDTTLTYGWSFFDVSSIDDSATITKVLFEGAYSGGNANDCNNDPDIRARLMRIDEDAENFHPVRYRDIIDLWDYLDSRFGQTYGTVTFDEDFRDWKGIDLSSEGVNEVQSLIDGSPTNNFAIGYGGETNGNVEENDCYYYIGAYAHAPDIAVYYTLPNVTEPFWPQCNPGDLCCNLNGTFRKSGYVCRSAHDAVCDSAASCTGHAYEDTCSGTASTCPNNNNLVASYPEACNDLTCVGQSCSTNTLQPQRTCSAGLCQVNTAYECPNNLVCANGNSCKTQATSGSDCKSGYFYDSQSKLCWSGDGQENALFYDPNGNLLSGFGTNYTYNQLNQLVNVTANGKLTAQYFYDDQGIRIKKIAYVAGKNTTTYYFDNFVQTVNSSGTFNETYYYYYDKLIGKKEMNGKLSSYHPDIAGSTSIITNSSGGNAQFFDYEPYGKLTTMNTSRYTFTGQELDQESGNLYMKARYQDPDMAQFIQPDQVTLDVYNPQDLNKYAYARDNPYKYRDSSGNYVETLLDIGFLSYDIIELRKDPSLVNWIALGGDSAGAALPFVTGLGVGVRTGARALEHLDELGDGVKIVGDNKNIRQVIGKVREVELPKEAQNVLSNIKSMNSGQMSKLEPFRNREGILPKRSDINYYKKQTVPTPNIKGEGSRRIIIGKAGETYYTFNHYRSFWRVIWKRIKW